MEVTKPQLAKIEATLRPQQLRRMLRTYIGEIRAVDSRLAAALIAAPEDKRLEYFRKVHGLTEDRLYQKALLAIWAASGVDVFSHMEFHYIREHPLLTGTAKARHIVLSFQVCSPHSPSGR